MKTSRYTEAQIIAILRQAEGGVPVAELCRVLGPSTISVAMQSGELPSTRSSPSPPDK